MGTQPFPKPALSDLTDLIDTVLASINANSAVYLNRNTVDAAYAGYVFGLILAAVERIADCNTVRPAICKSDNPSATNRFHYPRVTWTVELDNSGFWICQLLLQSRAV